MSGKKKYEDLDLIEKHRLVIWVRTRQRLLHHLEQIEQKLNAYDASSIPNLDSVDVQGGPSLNELDSFFDRVEKSTEAG